MHQIDYHSRTSGKGLVEKTTKETDKFSDKFFDKGFDEKGNRSRSSGGFEWMILMMRKKMSIYSYLEQ